MHPFNRDQVDPSVTDEELEQATADPHGDFPDLEEQDDLDELGAGAVVPATPAQAIANARRLRSEHTWCGVGYCLRTVRGPIYRVPALWPDANAALANGKPIHSVSELVDIPRGAVIGFHNSTHGHVTLGLGGGLNSTTDYHEPGYEGVATIANTAGWCGADRVVWYETLCGVDVWPGPAKPKPRMLTRDEKLQRLRADRKRALRNGHEHYAARLKVWIDRIAAHR